jgi:uncharacterized membrane protein SpoIIM required for sporulation
VNSVTSLTPAAIRWNETEIVLERLEKNKSENKAEDILHLGELYTELMSDLNKLNTQPEKSEERKRVNKLALRAYGAIYQPKSMGFTDFLLFFVFDFPKIVREKIHFILAAMMIFMVASLVGYLCISEKSKLIDLIISPEQQQNYQKSIKMIDPRKPHPDAYKSGFGISSFIMTNNIRVCIKSFATGIFLGIGTVYVLILNGLLLGGLASLYTSGGLAAYFWSLILPHGGIELLSIFIAGGAGLIIGHTLVNPGKMKRKDKLIIEGGKAIKLILGIIPMLVLAGLIEAYITPAHIPEAIKFILSAVFILTTLTWLYLGNIYSLSDLQRKASK